MVLVTGMSYSNKNIQTGNIYIYIYIYIEEEREGEREGLKASY